MKRQVTIKAEPLGDRVALPPGHLPFRFHDARNSKRHNINSAVVSFSDAHKIVAFVLTLRVRVGIRLSLERRKRSLSRSKAIMGFNQASYWEGYYVEEAPRFLT